MHGVAASMRRSLAPQMAFPQELDGPVWVLVALGVMEEVSKFSNQGELGRTLVIDSDDTGNLDVGGLGQPSLAALLHGFHVSPPRRW